MAVIAIAGLLASPLAGLLLSRFTSPRELGSIVVRIWYFREAWRRLLDNLPWGIGLGQGFAYPDHLGDIDPHNYWLVVGSEFGVIGVGLWVVTLVLLWRRIQRHRSDAEWLKERSALQIAFWLSQLHTLVEPTFQGVQYQYVFWWVFGGYLGYQERERALRSAAPRGPAESSER
jgi:hypothetical protein